MDDTCTCDSASPRTASHNNSMVIMNMSHVGDTGKGLTRVSCGDGGMVHKIWVVFLKACTTLFLVTPATIQRPNETHGVNMQQCAAYSVCLSI